MTQKVEGRYHGGFTAGTAIAPGLRVKLSSGKLALAGVNDFELGVNVNRTFADGDPATVDLVTGEGTTPMVASGAISAGADVFAAASGKVAATGSLKIGRAITAASTDGDHIEVLRDNGRGFTQSLAAAASEATGNSIVAGATAVEVTGVTVDANDFVVLPAIADVPLGHTIRIMANGGSNFELRTPATTNTKINDVDSDGTQEYLCTDTDMIVVSKRTTTGWVAQSITKLGAVRTAVVPD